MSEQEDPDLAIIKARKLKELQKTAAVQEKLKSKAEKDSLPKTSRELISKYLYDRGDEVLALAERQFPIQTQAIVEKIVEIMRSDENSQRISGGELLALFRSLGINIRLNTTIRIEDHGKLVSFSDKLKYEKEDNNSAKI